MKCPPLSRYIVFADNARLAAQVSCALAEPQKYLPICDGPRLQRPDDDAEVIRRGNAAARAESRVAVLAGLSDESAQEMSRQLTRHGPMPCLLVRDDRDLARIPLVKRKRADAPLVWGRDRIGIGLLAALRAGSAIEFEDRPSSDRQIPSKSGHVVVCEDGRELSQVIAANYAFALNAGLTLIPAVDDELANSLLEHFYRMNDPDSAFSPAQAREYLTNELIKLCGRFEVPEGGSVTFIGKLLLGFAFTDHPSTQRLIIASHMPDIDDGELEDIIDQAIMRAVLSDIPIEQATADMRQRTADESSSGFSKPAILQLRI
jgi:hypothetical protein